MKNVAITTNVLNILSNPSYLMIILLNPFFIEKNLEEGMSEYNPIEHHEVLQDIELTHLKCKIKYNKHCSLNPIFGQLKV
jgi:hypothetical protein